MKRKISRKLFQRLLHQHAERNTTQPDTSVRGRSNLDSKELCSLSPRVEIISTGRQATTFLLLAEFSTCTVKKRLIAPGKFSKTRISKSMLRHVSQVQRHSRLMLPSGNRESTGDGPGDRQIRAITMDTAAQNLTCSGHNSRSRPVELVGLAEGADDAVASITSLDQGVLQRSKSQQPRILPICMQ